MTATIHFRIRKDQPLPTATSRHQCDRYMAVYSSWLWNLPVPGSWNRVGFISKWNHFKQLWGYGANDVPPLIELDFDRGMVDPNQDPPWPRVGTYVPWYAEQWHKDWLPAITEMVETVRELEPFALITPGGEGFFPAHRGRHYHTVKDWDNKPTGVAKADCLRNLRRCIHLDQLVDIWSVQTMDVGQEHWPEHGRFIYNALRLGKNLLKAPLASTFMARIHPMEPGAAFAPEQIVRQWTRIMLPNSSVILPLQGKKSADEPDIGGGWDPAAPWVTWMLDEQAKAKEG
jgi:hypothetical protein